MLVPMPDGWPLFVFRVCLRWSVDGVTTARSCTLLGLKGLEAFIKASCLVCWESLQPLPSPSWFTRTFPTGWNPPPPARRQDPPLEQSVVSSEGPENLSSSSNHSFERSEPIQWFFEDSLSISYDILERCFECEWVFYAPSSCKRKNNA